MGTPAFIIGMLCLFRIMLQDPLPNPDPTKGEVPAGVTLLVATVDGVLRFFRLANMQEEVTRATRKYRISYPHARFPVTAPLPASCFARP